MRGRFPVPSSEMERFAWGAPDFEGHVREYGTGVSLRYSNRWPSTSRRLSVTPGVESGVTSNVTFMSGKPGGKRAWRIMLILLMNSRNDGENGTCAPISILG